MKNHLAVLFAIFLSGVLHSQCTAAQQDKNSKTSIEKFEKNGLELSVKAPSVVVPGSEVDLVISLAIPDGYHIYGSRDRTYPTKFKVNENSNVVLTQPMIPAGSRHAKEGGGANFWLEKRQTIKQTLTVAEDAIGDIELDGYLDFMICNEKTCKPPGKLSFSISLKVEPKQSVDDQDASKTFARPIRIMAAGEAITVEEPGFAAPCIADIDGDGQADLLVGQFNDGKIKVYHGLGKGQFQKGKWLKADGSVASVPGVW